MRNNKIHTALLICRARCLALSTPNSSEALKLMESYNVDCFFLNQNPHAESTLSVTDNCRQGLLE